MAALVLGSVPGCTRPSEAITVSAAISLSEALREVGVLFEADTGNAVRFNFGASSTLALQIEAGAGVDVFLSADEARMDALQSRRLVDPESRVSLLTNSLVIVVNRDHPAPVGSAADLAGPAVRRLALAEPGSVPAGIYARNYLQSLSLWEATRERVVPVENVRAALAAVASGDADAAIVYRTDARVSDCVVVAVEIPPGDGPPISYPVAVASGSPRRESAARFVRFLGTKPALDVFRRHGFLAAGPD
jgi:molybdate transport system substrate-binding protein